jgi:polysaccharide export outer membrane protein
MILSQTRMKLLALALTLAALAGPAAAQEAPIPELQAQVPDGANRMLLAISSDAYPVIPGDTYRLTYRTGGATMTNEVMVDGSYRLNLSIFGEVNGRGKTFRELKAEIERIVSRAYPNSQPTLTLVSVGLFEVIVRGAVPRTAFVNAWGLTRLSDAVQGNLAVYSSIRDVRIVSSDGTAKTYDLLRALRTGDTNQNPYIKPGDLIEISRARRIVEIQGEVFRPGSYQLLPDEGLEQFEFFTGGLTRNADQSRVRLERSRDAVSTVMYFDLEAVTSEGGQEIALENGDVLTVPSKTETMPVVFFEGAVESLQPGAQPAAAGPAGSPATGAAGTAAGTQPTTPLATGVPYNRIVYPFKQGETLYGALQAIRSSITPFANLSRAYIVRQGVQDRIDIDLERLLYDYSARDEDIPLIPFDRIVIPSSSFDVSVSGEVTAPGRYPFVPQRQADYYVGLAGGTEIAAGSASGQISVFSSDGTRKEPSALIEPGDRIFVHPESSVVIVNGGVSTPGTYPYVPQERYRYYVSRAGGADFERSTGNKVSVYAVDGTKRSLEEYVQPGDRIYVHTDSFISSFNRYFPIISTSLAFIGTIVTLINLLAGHQPD